uniref:Uncharacterized protein n=1 Tax=Rhipicephalus zambeziensis TaxID=60191 RepID=A0A224YKI1_9ACAR
MNKPCHLTSIAYVSVEILCCAQPGRMKEELRVESRLRMWLFVCAFHWVRNIGRQNMWSSLRLTNKICFALGTHSESDSLKFFAAGLTQTQTHGSI